MFLSFCDMSGFKDASITKMVNIFTRKDPNTLGTQTIKKYLDELFAAVKEQGLSENELLDLKLSHILTKHSKDRCPADLNFNDQNIINLHKFIEIQANEEA